jgi:DNA-binding transcriptional regulator GbsR (MarR family)
MSEDEQRFIDGVGDILASWNLPRATGRVYGYLLLHAVPVASEELRSELRLSAGAVSTATRELVLWGLARTIPQPGSRRLLVEAAGGFEQLLAASHERARMFVRTLRAGRPLTEGKAAERLDAVTGLFEAYIEAGAAMLRHRLKD